MQDFLDFIKDQGGGLFQTVLTFFVLGKLTKLDAKTDKQIKAQHDEKVLIYEHLDAEADLSLATAEKVFKIDPDPNKSKDNYPLTAPQNRVDCLQKRLRTHIYDKAAEQK